MSSTPQFDDLLLEIRKTLAGYRVRLSLPGTGYISAWGDSDSSLWNSETGTPLWIDNPDRKSDGTRIYKWLMQDSKISDAWGVVKARTRQRRIRLELDDTAPELAQVPWELMLNPDTDFHMAAGAATPFSRLLVGDEQVGAISERPVCILVVISNPPDLPPEFPPIPKEKIENFWRELCSNLQVFIETGQVRLVRLAEPVSVESLEDELKRGYHILHFIGHGLYSVARKDTFLYIHHTENGNDRPYVYGSALAAMIGRGIKDIQDLGRPFLRLVTLASCQTAVSGQQDMFDSLAMQLGKHGLPAILAMQDRVGMDAALKFSAVFYEQLLAHGLIDLSANEARQVLLTGGFRDAHVPVLYSRVRNNQLLEPVPFKRPKDRLAYEPEMVLIPEGRFFMGASPADPLAEESEKPGQWLHLPGYWIGKYPVTNREYAEFIQQTGRPAPDLNWNGQQPQIGKERHPVVGVTWHDAQAYCQWLAEQSGRAYRLPSEAEWEKAARGSQDQRIYPWGDQFDPARCWHDLSVPAQYPAQVGAVDRFEQSLYGCFDLIGNIREWTHTIWGENLHPAKSRFPYPWQKDGRESVETVRRYFKIYRVLRGGGAIDDVSMLRCSARDRDALDARYQCGFRIARDYPL